MKNKYRMLTKIVRNMNLKKNISLNDLNGNEAETLRYISKHPGIISNEIAIYLGVDKALITRIVKRLETLGYITIKSGEDKRKKLLYITDLGLSLMLDTEEFETIYYKKLFEGISEEEQNDFFYTLEKIYNRSKEIRIHNEKI